MGQVQSKRTIKDPYLTKGEYAMSFHAPIVPDEIAVLIMDIHGYRKDFYRQCLNRFRPYDLTTSRLFEALEAEEEEQQQEFVQLVYTTLGADIAAMTNLGLDKNLISTQRSADEQSDDKYFFVVNSEMAKTILEAALRMEYKTHCLLYERLCRLGAGNPTLRLPLKKLDTFVDNHRQVLEEAIARFYIQGPGHEADNASQEELALL